MAVITASTRRPNRGLTSRLPPSHQLQTGKTSCRDKVNTGNASLKIYFKTIASKYRHLNTFSTEFQALEMQADLTKADDDLNTA